MKSQRFFRRLTCTLATLVLVLTGIEIATAATIAVTTTVDELADPGPGTGCSLREAIQSINGGANYGGCANTGGGYGPGDTINVPAGTYTIARAGADEYLNATGSFDILSSVSIVGAGAGATTINGGGLDRVFYMGGTTLAISGVTITNGLSGGGSGIYNNSGSLTVINSTISGNSATGGQSCGGGIGTSLYSPVTVTGSTISGNSAGYCGGGIIGWSTLAITNSTISGNSAVGYGGGVFRGATGPGSSAFTNVTISANSAANGGGIWDDGGDVIWIGNSIVASQTSGADCSGNAFIHSSGHNMESGTICGFTASGDLQNTSPQLIALANNGGPTLTMALSTGSLAINAGDNAVCAADPVNGVDQRGIGRPQGSVCDIGAFEYVVPAVPSAAQPVPMLSAWAVIVLASLVGLAGFVNAQRKA